MRRLVIILAGLLWGAFGTGTGTFGTGTSGVGAWAQGTQQSQGDKARIRDVSVHCSLDSLGSAHITEVWDVHTVRGTEWYLVRENLGDIAIQDLCVREGEREFTYEDRWDTERSLSQKAGRCGLHPTSGGFEICWGIGSYDDHKFTVSYTMTNAVKSFDDYDMLHMQFISDGLSSYVEHAKVSVDIPGVQLDTLNARLWGFGYDGYIYFEGGEVVADPTEGLGDDDSVIILLRLDKGLIVSPQSRRAGEFQAHLDKALDGSHFKDDKSEELTLFQKIISGIVVFFVVMWYGGWLLLIPPIILIERIISKKKYLGTYLKSSVPWAREIPFGGDIVTSNYALSEFHEEGKNNAIASAMILQMIRAGAIVVRKDADGEVELAFGDESTLEPFSDSVKKLWEMMKEASGKDQVLQDKEFSTWSKSHQGKVSKWVEDVEKKGKTAFRYGIWCTDSKVNERGVEECRKAYGLKKYLKDFTLLKERTSKEAVLWEDYIIFAALFGIADKVARELKDIDPQIYETLESSLPGSLHKVINMSDSLAFAITKARNDYKSSTSTGSGGGGSRGGYGGHSSHSGGHGYSGGGRGGGCR